MKCFSGHAFLLVAVMGLAGCQKAATPPPPPSAPAAVANSPARPDPRIPTQAQDRLQTMKLWVGPHATIAELALSMPQQNAGMMFRTNMPENESMLFVSAYPGPRSFWMKNTSLPLSLAYLDPNGTILEIHDLQPFDTNPVSSVSENVQYVLETPQGWFKRHNVEPGTAVSSEAGPFKKIFVPVKR
jgi:uncharacterized membrane protein (UPF0127 family)